MGFGAKLYCPRFTNHGDLLHLGTREIQLVRAGRCGVGEALAAAWLADARVRPHADPCPPSLDFKRDKITRSCARQKRSREENSQTRRVFE